MVALIAALLALICSAVFMTGSLLNLLMSGNHRVFPVYSFLFVIYIIKANGIDNTMFYKLQACMAAIAASGLFSASNHFILSLDIISLFSAFILVTYHRFKMPQILPVK